MTASLQAPATADRYARRAISQLQPLVDANLGDFVFFKLVNDYSSNEIQDFGLELMRRTMRWVSTIALTVTTLWVLILGYRIATGQSRESAMATMIKAAKVSLIISIASAVGLNGPALHEAMTQNLDKEIHGLFTGDEDSSASDAIDENLAYTQIAMATLDAVRVDPSQPEVLEKKGRAMLMAGFGTASPPMAAGAMLLLFKFTMAFLIGIGPIFILALIFDQTKDLFKKWLFYVIGTLFSMAMLSVVTAMVLKFTVKVAAAYWAVKFIPLASAEGLSSQALQQGGIGLIMTMLIITIPTIAAALWQGNMGTFLTYTAFNNTAAPGPQGQPAGSYMPQQVGRDSNRQSSEFNGTNGTNANAARIPDQNTPSPQVGYRGLAGTKDTNVS
ncbi:type IV secretion system protein [Xanthomonas euvesicatoria pv. euvesicatoria]|nr:type IV secretion system protein [Xanthomonas euvesicatoria]AOY69144.1 Type IV secretion system protein virB6 [Xanthomonas euvesicatoria pv. vesicatoria str. 85-10]APO92880.1 Type IV secretion system protein virB6 [Xanthomonas euvesicatoria]KLB61720.1 Type IV secretion system protein virB6 [Xanthomonas euvesicatoria]KLB61769.1 Type IV secretion system protein virB6 [Xanthomonas euvesicatoria]MCC8501706.1 type IV secretion system protein [Xanthomonas euvesicatoria pv. euvesicatoria]